VAVRYYSPHSMIIEGMQDKLAKPMAAL